jgi:hypothetical protein
MNEPSPPISENKIYCFIMTHDPTAFARWGATNFSSGDVSGGLSFAVKSRRYNQARIDILPPHCGNNQKSDNYQIYYWDGGDYGPVAIWNASEDNLILTINSLVEMYEARVKDEDTQGEKLWNEIRALISAQEPAFFRKWGISRVENKRSREFDDNNGPEDWTGTRWDDSGVFAFQMPHQETTDLWAEIDGRYEGNESFTVVVCLGDADLESLDTVKPPELVAVLESLIKKYQNISEAELETLCY